MLDDGVLAGIVAAAGVQPGDLVLEIGPGAKLGQDDCRLCRATACQARQLLVVQADVLALSFPHGWCTWQLAAWRDAMRGAAALPLLCACTVACRLGGICPSAGLATILVPSILS